MVRIEEAIQQKNFKSEFQRAYINVIYTAAWLNQLTTQALRPHGISWQQFNILRILRGVHPQPATIKMLTERMIDKMSNASRIVDKLEAKALVVRKTCPDDRRRVDIALTEAGMAALAEASAAVEAMHDLRNEHFGEGEARQLNDLLDALRMVQEEAWATPAEAGHGAEVEQP